MMATAALCGTARAELTAKQVKEAEALVKACGDNDYQVRDSATKKLIEMGMDVAPIVRKAGEASTDAEVKARCLYVVTTLLEKAEMGPLEPAKITLDVKDKPLGDVVKELAKQSGNGELKVAGLEESKVTVKVKDMQYWQAVDEVCKSAGAYYTAKVRDGGGYDITLAAKTDQVTDAGMPTGPMSVRVGSVRRQDYRYLDLRGSGQAPPESSTLGFEMQVYLEDRLPLMRIGLELTSVLTADGVNHANPRGMGHGMARMPSGNVGGYWNMNLGWGDPAGTAQGAVTLEGTVELSCGLQPKELKLEKVFEKQGIEASADGKKLTLKETKRQGDAVIVMFTLEDSSDEGTNFAQGGGAEWGIFLLDPRGKRHSSMGIMSGRSGAMAGGGMNMDGTVVFQGVANIEGDWSLIYAYPGKVVKRSYPFTIPGVPVP